MEEKQNPDTSAETRDRKTPDRIVQEFMMFSSSTETGNVQKYINDTFIPNIRNRMNSVLDEYQIDLRTENNQYFNNPGGAPYSQIRPTPTEKMPGLRGAVGLVVNKLQQMNDNNSMRAYEAAMNVLDDELNKLQNARNAATEESVRAINEMRNQTNQAVHNAAPQAQNQEVRSPSGQQTSKSTADTGGHSSQSKKNTAEHAADKHGSPEQMHHKSQKGLAGTMWGVTKTVWNHFNILGPDFWAWKGFRNLFGGGQGHGHGHGHGKGHGHDGHS